MLSFSFCFLLFVVPQQQRTRFDKTIITKNNISENDTILTEYAENVTFLKLFPGRAKQLKKGDMMVYFIDYVPLSFYL
ncbi:hypothetical protein DXA36_06570 [Eisenbergiella sp. OF01-20]|nr:hypothetical protein DXA36_06570 [Eisenbergiella sp. OF01-20]